MVIFSGRLNLVKIYINEKIWLGLALVMCNLLCAIAVCYLKLTIAMCKLYFLNNYYKTMTMYLITAGISNNAFQ